MAEYARYMTPEILALMDYIETWGPQIFVREQVNGKWGSYALNELPADLAIKHAFNFLKIGGYPVRLKTLAERQIDDPDAVEEPPPPTAAAVSIAQFIMRWAGKDLFRTDYLEWLAKGMG